MSAQRRVGRPPKRVVGKGRSNLNFSINASLRRELVEAAASANRSLAAQIEWCIAYALAAERTLGDLKEYERKVKRGIDIKAGLVPPPGGFIPPEAAEDFLAGKADHLVTGKADRPITGKELDERLAREREEIRKMVDAAMSKKADDAA